MLPRHTDSDVSEGSGRQLTEMEGLTRRADEWVR
jgi:hypothetical protein